MDLSLWSLPSHYKCHYLVDDFLEPNHLCPSTQIVKWFGATQLVTSCFGFFIWNIRINLGPTLHGYCEKWMTYNTKPVRRARKRLNAKQRQKDSHATVLVFTHFIYVTELGMGQVCLTPLQPPEMIQFHLSRQLFTPILLIGGNENVQSVSQTILKEHKKIQSLIHLIG